MIKVEFFKCRRMSEDRASMIQDYKKVEWSAIQRNKGLTDQRIKGSKVKTTRIMKKVEFLRDIDSTN